MRTDAIAVFCSGQDFSSGNNTITEFENSPVAKVRDAFVAKYPDVPVITLTWHQAARLSEYLLNTKVVALTHSFALQSFLSAVNYSPTGAESIEVVAADPVRHSFEDFTDPTKAFTSTIFAQKFDRNPLPVPPEITSCTALLREGGQWAGALPESSPIVEATGRINRYVPGVDHNSILFSQPVQDEWWTLCDKRFKVTP